MSGAPIPYAKFDGRELPFEAATFDAVIFSFVLHHSQNAAGLRNPIHPVLGAGFVLEHAISRT